MSDHSAVGLWFQNLAKIWREKRPFDIGMLMSEEFEYYEAPFDEPIRDLKELVGTWREIETQDLRELDVCLLVEDEVSGVAEWRCKLGAEDGEAELRGAYYVRLDANGRSVMFKQWWNELS